MIGRLTDNINSQLTHIGYVTHIQYPDNKVSRKKEDVMKKTITKRKYIYRTVVYLLEKKICA